MPTVIAEEAEEQQYWFQTSTAVTDHSDCNLQHLSQACEAGERSTVAMTQDCSDFWVVCTCVQLMAGVMHCTAAMPGMLGCMTMRGWTKVKLRVWCNVSGHHTDLLPQ